MFRPHKPALHRSSTLRPAAFTLVELMVVIVMILVLASLVFTFARSGQRKAAGIRDIAVMRQIWQTIPIYAADHNGTLPGPLFSGQRSLYGPASTGRLSFYVAEDLGYTDLKRDDFIDVMSFSWQKDDKSRNAPCFFLREDLPRRSDPNRFIKPWGHPLRSGEDRKPKKFAGAMSAIDPARTWAMSDIDQLHPDVGDAGWKSEIPAEMSHGNYRTAIYFDGHAGKLDVNNNPK